MRSRRGVSLIEIMVALMILAVVGALIITLTLQILAATNSAKLRNKASSYAQQGLEQVRGYYQANGWASLASYTDTFSDPVFTRAITLTPNGNQVAVTVTITWTDKGENRNTSVSTYFFNY